VAPEGGIIVKAKLAIVVVTLAFGAAVFSDPGFMERKSALIAMPMTFHSTMFPKHNVNFPSFCGNAASTIYRMMKGMFRIIELKAAMRPPSAGAA
jgi:hypothetical protein